MTWVAVAIGGSAAVSAGVGLTGAFMGQNAAKDAASSQQQALFSALQTQRGTTAQMLQYFDPFRQMGLQAGTALTGELYSPGQQTFQAENTLATLQSQMKELQRVAEGYKTGVGVPLLTGKNASEKRKTVWDQMIADNKSQQAALQTQIEQQQRMVTQAQEQAKNPSSLSDMIEANPMYTAGSNVVSRRLAAQGLQGSQEAIRQEGTLAANVYQNQVANQLGIYQPTVGAAGQIATNIMQSGQNQAQTLGLAGQAQAQGTLNANQALWSGIGNATNSLNAGAGTLLNYQMFNNLMGSTGKANTTPGGWDPVMGTGTAPSGTAVPLDQRASLSRTYGLGS